MCMVKPLLTFWLFTTDRCFAADYLSCTVSLVANRNQWRNAVPVRFRGGNHVLREGAVPNFKLKRIGSFSFFFITDRQLKR